MCFRFRFGCGCAVVAVKVNRRDAVQMERVKGKVKWFNDKKGFGFISRSSGDDVFVHHTAILSEGFRTLAEGDQVEFAIKQDQKGPAAVDVRKI